MIANIAATELTTEHYAMGRGKVRDVARREHADGVWTRVTFADGSTRTYGPLDEVCVRTEGPPTDDEGDDAA